MWGRRRRWDGGDLKFGGRKSDCTESFGVQKIFKILIAFRICFSFIETFSLFNEQNMHYKPKKQVEIN